MEDVPWKAGHLKKNTHFGMIDLTASNTPSIEHLDIFK